MICSRLYDDLSGLFGDMSIVTFMLLVLGLMLIVVEFFQPSYRFPTYCGSVLIALGIIVRMLSGGTLLMLFYMVFGCAAVLIAAHLIMRVTQKRPWLSHSLALKLKRSMQEDDDGYGYLLGREGVATTDIDGNGHMTIDDVNFFVSGDGFISKGSTVRVVHVAGDSIKVMSVYEDGE